MRGGEVSAEPTGLAVRPGNVLEVLQQAVDKTQDLDIEKLRGLFELQKDFMRMQAEQAFHAAMARLQAKLPQINKAGQGKNSKFAKLEDIDVVIRPLLAEEEFSFSFDEESHTDKTVTFAGTISHAMGHSQTKQLTVPIDTAAANREGKSIRPAIQDAGSTVSYARRYLLKMHLNIIERDEDSDGESRKTITEDQAKDLRAAVQEVGMDVPRFLLYMAVGAMEEILAVDYRKAINAIEVKRQDNAKKAAEKK
jgi:hypothetical protein